MKKVLMISLGALTVLSLTVACPGSKHSAEECSPIVDEMLTNLTAGQKPEDAANIATMKATLVPVLQKNVCPENLILLVLSPRKVFLRSRLVKNKISLKRRGNFFSVFFFPKSLYPCRSIFLITACPKT